MGRLSLNRFSWTQPRGNSGIVVRCSLSEAYVQQQLSSRDVPQNPMLAVFGTPLLCVVEP
jgi:hypothetical protein